MGSSGLYLESSALQESFSDDMYVADSNIDLESEEEFEEQASTEVIQYITYNTVSDVAEYDTASMVDICCCGLLIGFGIALFAFLVRLAIYSTLNTFRAFTGAGKENEI